MLVDLLKCDCVGSDGATLCHFFFSLFSFVFSVEFGWTVWSQWTACSVSCGVGSTNRRFRQCINNDTLACVGDDSVKQRCGGATVCQPTNPGTTLKCNRATLCKVSVF